MDAVCRVISFMGNDSYQSWFFPSIPVEKSPLNDREQASLLD